MQNFIPVDAIDGKLTPSAFAWPGGYPIVYVTQYNDFLCPRCVTKAGQDTTVDCFVHWEGEAISCEECNRMIDSAYGEVSE